MAKKQKPVGWLTNTKSYIVHQHLNPFVENESTNAA